MDNYALFYKLLHAETEDEVEALLTAGGFATDDLANWQPLGGFGNNFGAVGNQQSDPSNALLEKIVNAIDAFLMARCYTAGIDPRGPDAPPTMAQASELFLGVPGGRLNEMEDPQQLRELSENIQLVAVGDRSSPSYLVIDTGEGQAPSQFQRTFLSLHEDNKLSIPFVQGRFNSGGTGILQFCGKKNFQLIASKRHPDCPVPPGDVSADKWGFTIVRRVLPSGNRKNSSYLYLAPNRQVLTFDRKSIQVMPGPSAKDRPATPYVGDLPFGTCVKLYDYRWPGRSLITTEGRYELERVLLAAAMPFRVVETRAYKAHYYSATVTGGWNSALAEDKSGDFGKLEPGFPAYADLNLDGVGHLPYSIAVFKGGTKDRRIPRGVLFVLNGQVHGALPSDFVRSRLKFDYLTGTYGTLLVMLDCAEMNQQVREDFFMASRDRVRANETYRAIYDQLETDLREHPGLQALNQTRRQEVIEAHQKDEGPREAFESLLKVDPTLASLFGAGERLVTRSGPGPRPEYQGRLFPTFFRITKEPDKGLVKRCPTNKTCRVDFETDAVNDYFLRSSNPGTIRIDPHDLCEHSHLWNGQLTTRFRVPWDAKPGDTIPVTVTVTDIEREARAEPFLCRFTIVAAAEVQDRDKPSGDVPPRRPEERGKEKVAAAFPPISEVDRASWAIHGFNKYSALKIANSPEGGFEFFVNVDNAFLLSQISSAKGADRPHIKFWFKYGLVLAALAMLKSGASSDGQSADKSHENEVDLDAVADSCNGLARAIVPIVRALGRTPQATIEALA
jgi:hypothetical protein